MKTPSEQKMPAWAQIDGQLYLHNNCVGSLAMGHGKLVCDALNSQADLLQALKDFVIRAEQFLPIPDDIMQAAYQAIHKAEGPDPTKT